MSYSHNMIVTKTVLFSFHRLSFYWSCQAQLGHLMPIMQKISFEQQFSCSWFQGCTDSYLWLLVHLQLASSSSQPGQILSWIFLHLFWQATWLARVGTSSAYRLTFYTHRTFVYLFVKFLGFVSCFCVHPICVLIYLYPEGKSMLSKCM